MRRFLWFVGMYAAATAAFAAAVYGFRTLMRAAI